MARSRDDARHPRGRLSVLLPAFFLSSSAALAAQESAPFTPPLEFAIDQWTTRDGLPQNSVNAILQTRDGYLWVGTFGGLARFDGSSFSAIERSDSGGRHIDRVLSLAEGQDGALWVGTENGLLRREDGAYDLYTTASGLPANHVGALHVSRAGVLWIGTAGGGLTRFAEGRFETIREVDGVRLDNINSFVEEAGGRLWVNGGNGRLLTIEGDELAAARWRAPVVAGAIQMPLQDRSGAHWFSLEEGLAWSLDGAVRTYDAPGGSIMVEDPGTGYWLGSNLDGLFYFRPAGEGGELDHYALPDGRSGYRVRAAQVDRDGNVWIGTDADGLLRARRNVFTTYTTAHGLSHDVATAVYGAADGTVWAGTNCGGVNAIDPRGTVRVFKPRQRNDPSGDPCVFALTEGPPGTMWAGTYGGGLTRIRAGREERLHGAGGLRDSVILALFTDRAGTVWAGTASGGLAALEDGRVRDTYTTADGLAHNAVRTIQQTRDGALWIGTLDGLSRFGDGRFTTYTAADGLSAGHVRAIHEDADGTLWIGTYGGGLNRFRDGVFTPIMREDGLSDNVVSAILEDDRGRFWMSGNRGIVRVARRDLEAFADGHTDRVHSVLYGESDGLLNPETNGGFQPAGWKDARGHLWFPTLEGMAVVDPARVVTDARPPPVMMEAVVVDGVTRPAEEEIVIGPGRANLEFRYAGLSLTHPEHLTFRYRLDGFEREWVDVGTRRVAYYPQLPPGEYRFVVRAANRDGVWNETGAGLALRVVPPVWNAEWFRPAAAAVFLVLIGAILWWRERTAGLDRAAQAAFSRRLIESQEQERKRISAELHDGLGQELLVVQNRTLLALRSEGLDAGAREQLRHITDVVGRSLVNVRRLAHNLRPHQLEHLGVSAALESMVEAVAEAAEIDIESTIGDIDGLLSSEGEINLYRVVQEGLNNIVRHSGAKAAAVSVELDGQVIEVTIVDQGRGFRAIRKDGEDQRVGLGLTGMAERVRILAGRVEVVSTPGEGTRIRVIMPVSAREPRMPVPPGPASPATQGTAHE